VRYYLSVSQLLFCVSAIAQVSIDDFDAGVSYYCFTDEEHITKNLAFINTLFYTSLIQYPDSGIGLQTGEFLECYEQGGSIDPSCPQPEFCDESDDSRWRHKGLDYNCEIGTPIFSLNRGVVVSNNEDGWGELVIHDAEKNVLVNYQHLNSRNFEIGSYVNIGDQVGTGGNTAPPGLNLGPHSHIGILPENNECIENRNDCLGPQNHILETNFDPRILHDLYPIYEINDGLDIYGGGSYENKFRFIIKLEFPIRENYNETERYFGYLINYLDESNISDVKIFRRLQDNLDEEYLFSVVPGSFVRGDDPNNNDYDPDEVNAFYFEVELNKFSHPHERPTDFTEYNLSFSIINSENKKLDISTAKKVYFVGPFHDIVNNSWYQEYVRLSIHHGFIKGNDGNLFPAEPITRGEAAKLIVIAANSIDFFDINDRFSCSSQIIVDGIECLPIFEDVNIEHPLFKYVQTLKNNNIFLGNSDDNFHPEQNITRGLFTKLLVDAFDLPAPENTNRTDNMSDILGHNYQNSIEVMVNINRPWIVTLLPIVTLVPPSEPLLSGTSKNSFSPDILIDRATALKAIFNCYEFTRVRLKTEDLRKNKGTIYPSNPQLLGSNFEQPSNVISNPPDSLILDDGTNHILITENNLLELTYSDEFDIDNDQLFFFWSSSHGELMSNHPEYQSIFFTPPSVNRLSDFELFTLSGDYNGNIATGLFDITVVPSCISEANFFHDISSWSIEDGNDLFDLINTTGFLISNLPTLDPLHLNGQWRSIDSGISGNGTVGAYYDFQLDLLYESTNNKGVHLYNGAMSLTNGLLSPCGDISAQATISIIGLVENDQTLTVVPLNDSSNQDSCSTGDNQIYQVASEFLTNGSTFDFEINRDENCNLFLTTENCAWTANGECISDYKPFSKQDDIPPEVTNIRYDGCIITFDVDDDNSPMRSLHLSTYFDSITYGCQTEWGWGDQTSITSCGSEFSVNQCPKPNISILSTSSGFSIEFKDEENFETLPDYIFIVVTDGSGNSTEIRVDIQEWCDVDCTSSPF